MGISDYLTKRLSTKKQVLGITYQENQCQLSARKTNPEVIGIQPDGVIMLLILNNIIQ